MTEENNILKNGARLLGETILTPGASLLCDGQVKSGLLHVGAGLIARFTLGMPGLLVVAADSYSKTVTGKSLLQNFIGNGDKKKYSSDEETSNHATISESDVAESDLAQHEIAEPKVAESEIDEPVISKSEITEVTTTKKPVRSTKK
jgi:hypothetical protein